MRRDEIISLISKIKRDMPHNKPVMALCEEVEKRILESSQVRVLPLQPSAAGEDWGGQD